LKLSLPNHLNGHHQNKLEGKGTKVPQRLGQVAISIQKLKDHKIV
jgi:hypothetical protein